jgi:hypothetical protein
MAKVQFYLDDMEARLFEKEATITIDHPLRDLTIPDVTRTLRQFGYKLQTKWSKTEWGWEARFSRCSK